MRSFPCCAYSHLIIEIFSVYSIGMKIHWPLQYVDSILKVYIVTKLCKILISPPTKQYAHPLVQQHVLTMSVSSGMLLYTKSE